jgi:transposase
MQRKLLVPTLLLAALVGCQGDAQYSSIHVSVEDQSLTVSISGPAKATPCPPALVEGTAWVNGIAMELKESGGGEFGNETDEQDCMELVYELDIAQLPAEAEALNITFDTLRTAGGHRYEAADDWHMTVDWAPERIWTDDDLAARMHAHEEFELQWMPKDTLSPELELSAYANNKRVPVETELVLVHSEPGKARYRFDGPEPNNVYLWSMLAIQQRTPKPTLCRGFKHCRMTSSLYESVPPDGIVPITPEGVAHLWPCLVAADGGLHYRSPEWWGFPDLSKRQLARNEACDGADLYFAVLGVCGLCGGGKSTYVVGNRGTQPATFSVRSNQETVEGGALEPQQLSKPFEIGFDGKLSALEIATEDDCDQRSNTEWVASIVCEQLEYRYSLEECGVQNYAEWSRTGMCRVDQEAGCNNLCGS